MYEVISAETTWMDRFVSLKDLQTGVIEGYFDDSMTFSEDDFEFMQEHDTYYCKIRLVGDQVSWSNEALKFLVKDSISTQVGNTKFLMVKTDEDEYYILKDELKLKSKQPYFYI